MTKVALALSAVLLLAPLSTGSGPSDVVVADYEFGILAAAGVEGSSLLLFTTDGFSGDARTVLMRTFDGASVSPPEVVMTVPPATYASRLLAAHAGDFTAVVVKATEWAPPAPPGGTRDYFLGFKDGAGPWHIVSLPFGADASSEALRPLASILREEPVGLGVTNQGTVFVLTTANGVTHVRSYQDGSWADTQIAPVLSFLSFAMSPDGVPHVFFQRGPSVIEWTPTGEHVVYQGSPGEGFGVAFSVLPDGSAWGAIGKGPVMGGTPGLYDPPDGGTFTLLQRLPDGPWEASPTGLKYWTTPLLSADPAGNRYFLHHDQGTPDIVVYSFEWPNLRRLGSVVGTQDALPSVNVLPARVLVNDANEAGYPAVILRSLPPP